MNSRCPVVYELLGVVEHLQPYPAEDEHQQSDREGEEEKIEKVDAKRRVLVLAKLRSERAADGYKKDCYHTDLSAKPLTKMFGAVPTRLARPPIVAEYATASRKPTAKCRSSGYTDGSRGETFLDIFVFLVDRSFHFGRIALLHDNRMAMFARGEFDLSQVQIFYNERRKFPMENCRGELITIHRCRRFLSRVFVRLEALAVTFEFIGNGQGDGQHNRGSGRIIDPHGEKSRDAHQSSHGPS